MEAIFIVAIGLVSATTMATAAAPAKLIDPPALHAAGVNVAVVTITAKRLSAAEKAQLAD